MSNSFTGDPPITIRVAGIMPRRPSYASVVSGPPSGSGISQAFNNQAQRAGALSHLLNNIEFPYDNNYFPPTTHSPNIAPPFYSSRSGEGNMAGGYGSSWGHNGGDGALPSISRAFGLFTNRYGNTASADSFFVPSYLHGSQHMEKLADAHRAKLAAQRDVANSTHSSQPGSLSTSASSVNLHAKVLSHRGMTYDLIEKAPPLEDDGLPPLPSRWNQNDKNIGMEIVGDGLEVKLTGPKPVTDRDHEACSIRADRYMPPHVGLYYFEVTILSRKREESSIGIGFSGKDVSLSRVPGWEPDSWAYHGDDGHSFCCQQTGKSYGPKFSGGDVIGCGINFRLGQAFFTKNGVHLSTAFRDIKGKLYPSVGMRKAGEHVRVNFGQSPFVFDIDGLMENEKLRIREQVELTSTAKLAPPLSETQLIQKLVLQFLVHDGYAETARAFATEVNEEDKALNNISPTEAVVNHDVPEDEDAVHRQRIRTAILEGDIDKALKHTNAYYPDVLKHNEDIYFRLRCRKFIEMIRQGAEMSNINNDPRDYHFSPPKSHHHQQQQHHTGNGHNSNNNGDWFDDAMASSMELDDQTPPSYLHKPAHQENGKSEHQGQQRPTVDYSSVAYQQLLAETLAYGQILQAEFKDDPRREVGKALKDAFALVAYPDPWNAEGVSHLLDKGGRTAVAEELNGAILVSLGQSSSAALEQVYQQTVVLLEDLRESGGIGAFVNLGECVAGKGVMWENDIDASARDSARRSAGS